MSTGIEETLSFAFSLLYSARLHLFCIQMSKVYLPVLMQN